MDKKAEHPVQNKRFFIEIKNSPKLVDQVTECIRQLNGQIESFLNSNVNYVVTNRPKHEWPQKKETQSSTASIIHPPSLSRASKMLQSTQNVPKTTDPLEMARKFDKKIISAADLIGFLKKHTNTVPLESKNTSTNEVNNRKLAPPYIKVVDNSAKYKSNFKELSEWPEINFEFQPELCPFYKPRKPSISANMSQQSNKSAAIAGKQNDRFQTVLTTPILTQQTPTLNANTVKSITTATKNASKRKNMTFCEICHKEYDDFEKHLNDETHASFLNNDNNFTELFGVIKSLPPFFSNQQMHMFKNSRLSGNSGKGFTDISNVIPMSASPQSCLQQQSPNDSLLGRKIPSPLMRSIHSINTWESKHSFISLHNLVNDDENLNNPSLRENLSSTPGNNNRLLMQEDFENNENKPIVLENQTS